MLAFELAGLTDFDELFLTGDITDGDTLETDNLGGYMPTVNDSFQVITLAVAAIPEPEQSLLMLAGLDLIGAVVRRRARR